MVEVTTVVDVKDLPDLGELTHGDVIVGERVWYVPHYWI